MARPTSSFAIYYQQIGRGVRIHPDKEDVLITDFSDNIERFGKIEGIKFDLSEEGKWEMFNGKCLMFLKCLNLVSGDLQFFLFPGIHFQASLQA